MSSSEDTSKSSMRRRSHAHANTARFAPPCTSGTDVSTSWVTPMRAHDNKLWRPHRSMHAHTRVRTQESKDIIHDGAVFGEEAMLLNVRQRH